jgi:non-specific serine/threonine protein kinase
MNQLRSIPLAAKAAFTLLLTPQGHLLLASDPDDQPLPAELQRFLADTFALGAGHGLLHLGARQIGTALPPVLAWWRDFASRYVTLLCATTEDAAIVVAPPGEPMLNAMIADAPPMRGAEYLTARVLRTLLSGLDTALRAELAASKQTSLQDFLKACHPAWNLVGRVHFNLAENRKDADAPFAFLATYTSGLSAHGKTPHLPLSQALGEFSDGKSQAQLLSLLKPVQAAAQQCSWLREMVDTGEIYHPLRWMPANAWQFLCDVPKLEAAGIVVRAPRGHRYSASLGARPPSLLGQGCFTGLQHGGHA